MILTIRGKRLQQGGMSRKSIDTLRGGLPTDPVETGIILLLQLLELNKRYPYIAQMFMNSSIAERV